MNVTSRFVSSSLLAFAGILFAGCAGNSPAKPQAVERIACHSTPDCNARGGTCVDDECVADNECSTDADCASGQNCQPDPDFGGLCTTGTAPAMPTPAWACSADGTCPVDQFCDAGGLCELLLQCASADDCAAGQYCNVSADGTTSVCASGGPQDCTRNPDGTCTVACTTDGDCANYPGSTCGPAGICVGPPGNCTTDADCASGLSCEPVAPSGALTCIQLPPQCQEDAAGNCITSCTTDSDCNGLLGDSCQAGVCTPVYCTSNADCPSVYTCLPEPGAGVSVCVANSQCDTDPATGLCIVWCETSADCAACPGETCGDDRVCH